MPVQRKVYDAENKLAGIMISEGGTEKPKADFDKALTTFSESGKAPKGFVFVDPSTLTGSIRQAFEKVNQPVQQGAQAFDQGFTGMANKVRDLIGKKPVEAAQSGIAGRPAGFLAESVDTPEKAGTMAGYAAGTAATGGMAGIAPSATRALSSGVGNFVGALLDDSKPLRKKIESSLITTALTAGTEGAFGFVSKLFGKNLSKQAQEGVAADIMDIMKEKSKTLGVPSKNMLNAYASTKKGVEDLTRVGVKALRGDSNKLVTDLQNEIQAVLPATLKRRPQTDFVVLMKRYGKASDQFLDNIGSETGMNKATENINAVKQEVVELLKTEFPNMSDQAKVKIFNALKKFVTDLDNYVEAAEVLHALKVTGKSGFNAQKLQEYMRERTGSALFEKVGTAAGRGVRGGIDEVTDIKIQPFKNSALGKYLSVGVPGSKVTKFSGRVLDPVQQTLPRAGTYTALKEFLERD